LSGQLVSEASREPIAGHTVVLRKLYHPWWCIFCLGGYRDYATTTTDESGHFEFVDAKSGWYEVATRCPPNGTFEFAARVNAGELVSGSYQVVVEHGIEHCTFNR
jgi:hypothetical protein